MKKPTEQYPRFRAIIFDMDGTLTVPTLDFGTIRQEIGLGPGDLAELIAELPPDGRERAWSIIEAHEARAMHEQQLQPGAQALLQHCRRDGIRLGVVTRNAMPSVRHLCERFDLEFDMVVTREFPFMKPHPEPVRHLLQAWQIEPRQAIMVGDYLHDLECGRAAGALTCFFQNPGHRSYAAEADYSVSSMEELRDLIYSAGTPW
jgi:HAD superfamily hydrolase (TIGR01509 family)